MSSAAFRNLAAYRLAAALADEIYAMVGKWSSFDRWSTGVQLVRAADSVGANIAESAGRWHEADKRRLCVIARGSLYETEHWLERAQARGLTGDGLESQIDELARTLNGLLKRPNPG